VSAASAGGVIIRAMVARAAGPFFILAGALHFAIPDTYEKIVPRYLPARRALVYVSGVAEIAGGAGLLHRRTRAVAGWWLIATLAAVFPANVDMARHPDRFGASTPLRKRLLAARLPLQLLLVAWVRRAAGEVAAP
jgi:uncharacterized membrane protein